MKSPFGWLMPIYERDLLRQCRHIPHHIAFIQDGNRRFAKMIGKDTAEGHRAGADRTEEMLEWACDLGVRHITLYSFSTENFQRGSKEIEELFSLFKEKFQSVLDDERVNRNQIKVQMLGDRTRLPADLLEVIDAAEAATKHYNNYHLHIALAYGGRNEILTSAKKILGEVSAGVLAPEAIDTQLIETHLYDGCTLPPVDLIIRTGNDCRTSNFLPWLANGHECAVYFCAPYWPMFRRVDLLRAVRVYSQRMDQKQVRLMAAKC